MLPVASDFIEGVQGATFSVEDVFGGLGPSEGLRSGVVLGQVVEDGGLEFIDAGIAAAADALQNDRL